MMLMLPDIDLREQIYEGMVSRVYRGVRRDDGVPIIFKLLKGEYPSLEARQRYQQEYSILRELDLEGVVKAYGLRELNHGLAIVFEDFGGRSLDQWLTQRRFSLEEVLDYGMRIVQILDGLHAAQIIHRDLNPSNLVLNPDTDTLKLIDFGLAKRGGVGGMIGSAQLRRIAGEEAGLGVGPLAGPAVGFSGVPDPVVEGTLAYMAPEQTGRMQQRVDYRADYYALGVTLYEGLTQQLPFSAEDPLELIHCHLAKVPPTPRDRCPEIPQAVSEIVMRLLAKQPEDRYQSAYGLQADLQICLQQWRHQGRVWTIPLGRQDRRTQLRIEGRLYGRESQRKQLQLMLEQVQRGERGWVMVSGYSGIGKSSLVQELQGPVAQMRGYFLRGKCEQLQRERPYQAIAQALDGLVQALLTEPACLLHQWRAQILPRLENQGQLLIDLVPQMGVLLGEQPPLARATSSLDLTLMAQVNTQRWYRVIQSCLAVTRQVLEERPVLLVLDDLQWIDVATLQLLQRLWGDPELKGIGFMGAYRNHEVDATHPLSLAIAAYKSSRNSSRNSSLASSQKSLSGVLHEIQLAPLTSADVNQLIADSLDTPPDQTKSLTDLVFAKTQGNPFFVNVFLTALHSDRLLYFDRQRGEWSWELEQIRTQASTDNVVELLAHRIQRLPPAAQQVLRWAACIGHRFGRLAPPSSEGSRLVQSLGLDGMQGQGGNLGSEVSLDIAGGEIQAGESLSALGEPMDIQACLDLLVERELIVAGTEDTGRLPMVGLAFEGSASAPRIPIPTLSQKLAQTYTFVHDRVQQAAYSLIPLTERSYYHWTLGQWLQRAAAIADRPDAHLFDWVNQLNLAAEASRAAFGTQPSTQPPSPQPSAKIRPYPAQEGDRLQLIRLNLQAGKQAKLAAAYPLSVRYCRAALEQIIPSDWQQNYDLAAEVYRHSIEVALATSEFTLMESWTATALTHSRDDVDTAGLVRLQIMACMVQNQPQQAIALTIPILRTFGITLPRHPKLWHVILGALRLRWQLRNKTDAQILALPPLQDRAQQAAIGIINYVGTASYLTASNFQALLTFAVIRQSLRSGNSSGSAQSYVIYGIAQTSIVGNIPLGNRFAQLALQLTDHLGADAREVRSRVLFLSYYLIRHWQMPLRDVIAPLQQAYAVGLEAGDIEYAAYSFYASVQQRFVAGDCLSDLIEPFALVYQRVAQLQQKTALQWTQLYQQVIANLIEIPLTIPQSSGVETVPYRLVGEFYDEDQMEPIHRQARDKTSLFLLHSYQLMLAYLFGDYAAAEGAAQRALAYADAARGASVIPGFVFYDALVQLAGCAPERGGAWLRQAPKDRRRRLRRVAQHCKQLAYWVNHCAYNHQHRLSLVEAERARVLGQVEGAIAAYSRAIAQAQHCGQLQDEAVAQELAGRFYWGLGQVKIAQMYLQEARYTYLRWGAIAKVAAMDRAYTELLPSGEAELGLALSRERELGGVLGRALGRDSLQRYGSALDLLSITKASQAISGEIHWDKLLAKLMTMILESAGAETADLLLNHHGRWYVEASASLGAEPLVTLVTQMPLDECDRLPHSVLNYCIHSQEYLVLADAAGEAYGDLRFSHDPAIAKRRPRSLLCLPLMHQGQLIGLLYLANHLTAQVFSAQRVEVLRLLCSQATISLENARLYAETYDHARTLEQKVAERTQELKEANDELQRLVMLDSLTQVANRRCFDAVLQREWHRMQRQQQPLALILADVDYFKRYNDRYGHPTGDRCLQLVAQALQRAIKRSSDLVARYGGEEFAILLPNTSAKVAILLAKSLRQEMRRLAIPHEGSEVSSSVTMSLGIGYCVPKRGQTPQVLIDQADQALYQAKLAGRDRHWLFVASNDDQ